MLPMLTTVAIINKINIHPRGSQSIECNKSQGAYVIHVSCKQLTKQYIGKKNAFTSF